MHRTIIKHPSQQNLNKGTKDMICNISDHVLEFQSQRKQTFLVIVLVLQTNTGVSSRPKY